MGLRFFNRTAVLVQPAVLQARTSHLWVAVPFHLHKNELWHFVNAAIASIDECNGILRQPSAKSCQPTLLLRSLSLEGFEEARRC